jgi:antitoxin ParD1/3/4
MPFPLSFDLRGGIFMPTRNVVLTERQETLIEALVQSGRYQNASEVMREGLRLVENREVEEATKLAALRAAAQLGVSALDRGEFKEFADASFLVAHLDKIGDEAISGAGDT